MADALSWITGIGGLIANPISTMINNAHNEQLIKEQNQWNLEQWDRENFYNSPSEQMKRLKAAGLNPNLMYGNGAGSMLSAPSPTMQSSRTEAPQVDSLAIAQLENIRADTQEKQSHIPVNIQQANMLAEQTGNIRKQTDLLISQKDLVDAQAKNELMQFATDMATFEPRVKTLFFLSGQAEEDYGRKVMENLNYPEFISKTISHLDAVIANLKIDSSSKKALMAKIQPEIENLRKSTELVKSQKRSIDVATQIQQDYTLIDKIFGYITGTFNVASPFISGPKGSRAAGK